MENFGSFTFKFEINIRKTIRLIESTDKKLINAELASLFNETCKKENILPRYTDKYIHIHLYICSYISHLQFLRRSVFVVEMQTATAKFCLLAIQYTTRLLSLGSMRAQLTH